MNDLRRLYYYITASDRRLAALRLWGTIKDDLTPRQQRKIVTAWQNYDRTHNRSEIDRAVTTIAAQVSQ